MEVTKIEEAFISEGYTSIPFSFNAAGHPIIKATVFNNVEANFLLDTGASINLLDYQFAKELNLNLTLTEGKGGGAGGPIHEIYSLDNILLEVGRLDFKFDSFFSIDFSTMKEVLTATGVSEEIQGILGFGFFQMTKCFIDYAGSRIFILNN